MYTYHTLSLSLSLTRSLSLSHTHTGNNPSLAAEGLWRAGLIHWQSFNDTSKAYDLFSRARTVDPTHAQGLHALAALEAQSGDVDEALILYEDTVRLLPSDPDTVGELADLYQNTGRIDESERMYLATLALRPTDVDAIKGYAHLLKHHRGQSTMAAQLFDMSKTLAPILQSQLSSGLVNSIYLL